MAGKKKAATPEIENVDLGPAGPETEVPTSVKAEKRNGVTMPIADSICGKIWQLATDLSERAGQPVDRKFVIEECTAMGFHIATITTQHQRWRKFYGLTVISGPKAERAAMTAEERAIKAALIKLRAKCLRIEKAKDKYSAMYNEVRGELIAFEQRAAVLIGGSSRQEGAGSDAVLAEEGPFEGNKNRAVEAAREGEGCEDGTQAPLVVEGAETSQSTCVEGKSRPIPTNI